MAAQTRLSTSKTFQKSFEKRDKLEATSRFPVSSIVSSCCDISCISPQSQRFLHRTVGISSCEACVLEQESSSRDQVLAFVHSLFMRLRVEHSSVKYTFCQLAPQRMTLSSFNQFGQKLCHIAGFFSHFHPGIP